jgi:hypothetical protein
MRQIFVFVLAIVACFLFIACGEDSMNPTANDMRTTPTSMAPSSFQAQAQSSIQASKSQAEEHHVKAQLLPVGDSGITGHVNVEQLPHGGVNISVSASGLTTGEEYVSLYYENHTCELEPYEEDDVIGEYTGNAAGQGQAHNKLEDDLDDVNSISVRRASDFQLLSCADTHPE